MHTRISEGRFFTAALAVSALVHAMLLFIAVPHERISSFVQSDGGDGTVTVELLAAVNKSLDSSEHTRETAGDVPISSAESSAGDNNASADYYESAGCGEISEYYALLKEKIIRAKQYPEHARWLNICGENKVSFLVDPAGRVAEVRLISKSGYPILDNETCDAVRRASPFPPIPSQLGSGQIEVAVTLHYKL